MADHSHRKTIAIVSNTSWSIYNFRLGLIRYLKASGFEVLLVAPKDTFTSKLIAEGFGYQHVDIDNYGVNALSDLQTVGQLVRIYRQHHVDFIFHYTIKPNIYGTIAAAWCKIPSIAVTTGLGHMFTFKNSLLRFGILKMYRFAASLSKEVWFLNQSDRQTFVEHRIVKPEKTFVLPSEGINIDWFKADYPPITNSLRPKLKFLFAGRLIWDKGIGEVAEAARIIKKQYANVEFLLVGFIDLANPNSVQPEQIQAWQNEKILRYLGETTDMRSILRQIDCLVFPSFYREGVSRILLEAAATGRPIITTDNVGCREVVNDGSTGYLCEPRNVADLTDKIVRFIQLSPAQRLQMSQLARQKVVAEFDERLIIEQYAAKIEQYLFPQRLATTPLSINGIKTAKDKIEVEEVLTD